MASSDYIIVGGGLVGLAIGFGLTRLGAKVTLMDEGDTAFRAARGNFGNIWVQGKGIANPAYAEITRSAAVAWRAFAEELEDCSGIDIRFRQEGAAFVCFSQAELDERASKLQEAEKRSTIKSTVYPISASELRKLSPRVGPMVHGATFCNLDGVVDPLRLLNALARAFQKMGGTYLTGGRVHEVRRDGEGFAAVSDAGRATGQRLVLAAGLGNVQLAPMVGLKAPLRPLRGQILVTEKLQRFMDLNFHFIRQTPDGGVLCGESSEEAGYDEGITLPVVRRTAERLVSVFPFMRNVRLVRAWGALRVMSPDGEPIFAESETMPGAFLASVHSGVTLTPFHATQFARHLFDKGHLIPDLAANFSAERFNV